MSKTYTISLAILCILLAGHASLEQTRFSLWWWVYLAIGAYAAQLPLDLIREWWGRREKRSEDYYALISEKLEPNHPEKA